METPYMMASYVIKKILHDSEIIGLNGIDPYSDFIVDNSIKGKITSYFNNLILSNCGVVDLTMNACWSVGITVKPGPKICEWLNENGVTEKMISQVHKIYIDANNKTFNKTFEFVCDKCYEVHPCLAIALFVCLENLIA